MVNITRREFIKTAGVVSAAALTSCLARANERPDGPNIFFALADDWSWPHAGVYGDKVIKTPTFDRLASEGVLFNNAFCTAPTCTASRGAVLTGQMPYRLEEGANLHSMLRDTFRVYPDVLEEVGYFVGSTRKGWAPGTIEGTGRIRNPAGTRFRDFATFLSEKPDNSPFCFWFGSTDPHRPYEKGSGVKSGMRLEDVEVPPYLPDTPEVRSDLCDYYFATQKFDREVGECISLMEKQGLLENTIVVMTGDNGLPFPRAKANLYDAGTHMPLAVAWPAKVQGGRRADDFVCFTDFAPTFLEAAGLRPLPEMTGVSFLDVLTGEGKGKRAAVFPERERHTTCREDNGSYPSRACRTKNFLYIRNFRPDRFPAGDPRTETAGGKRYCDIDGSPSKDAILDRRDDPKVLGLFALACAKRPEEELYDLRQDPWQMENVADRPEYADARKKMRQQLDRYLIQTGDPRITNDDDRFDQYAYHGKLAPVAETAKPNVVFIFSDQQRWDSLGCYGQQLPLTPNLDRMASEGVQFRHAFTCQPVCGPARSALQTGKYPTEIGCHTNNRMLPITQKTMAHHLSIAGYEVGYIGKWHLASKAPKGGPDDFREKPIPPERRGGYKDFWLASDVLEFTSHGYDGHMFNADMEKVEFPEGRYRVDALTDFAVEYLRTREQEKPFFLFLSYIEPHHQNDRNRFEGPHGSKEKFADAKIPGDLEGTEGDWREQYADYLGCINALDTGVGRIREELEKLGLAENTLVIYTSDHACHFRTRNGEYKRSCHDNSIRIPMIACGPGFTGGQVVEGLASLIDLTPTVLTAGGAMVPGMRGRPLQSLIAGVEDWPEEVFVQISESQVGRAIRTRKWKYSVRAPEGKGGDPGSDLYVEDFLYDLEADPHERNNLVADPQLAEVRRELSLILRRRMIEAGESDPVIRPAQA